MGECILYGNGGSGGGAGLNFKVVGSTTEPANPKENTIWVNTDVEITDWAFSTIEPENFSEGMVWIQTSVSSNVEFNALKKGSVQVYPVSTKQYVNGAWVGGKETKIYKDGAWVAIAIYLVQSGVDVTSLTGGWQDAKWAQGVSDWVYPSVTFSNGAMSISYSGSKLGCWGKSTKNTIDLTDIKSIELTCNATATGKSYSTAGMNASIEMFVGKSPSSGPAARLGVVSKGSKNGTLTLNVESLTGEYYIGFFSFGWVDGGLTTNIKVYDFELKRE